MCVLHYGYSLNFLSGFSGYLLTQENISGVLTEVPPLISESDLHISQVHACCTAGVSFVIITSINNITLPTVQKKCPRSPHPLPPVQDNKLNVLPSCKMLAIRYVSIYEVLYILFQCKPLLPLHKLLGVFPSDSTSHFPFLLYIVPS